MWWMSAQGLPLARTTGAWMGVAVGLVLVAAVAGCRTPTEHRAGPTTGTGVLSELRSSFARVSPAVTRVWILDVGTRPWGSGSPDAGAEYAVVATAWQPGGEPVVNERFSGAGELFGVFVVDSTFSRVNRVLHIFPTRRWHDYRVYLDVIDSDTITVLGGGETYRDEPIGFKLDWKGRGQR